MNSQMNTKQMKARQIKQTAERTENVCAMERNQNTDNGVPAISSPVASRKSLRLSTHRECNILGRTGYYV